MARNMKASWQIILKRSKEEKRYTEENTTRPRLRKKKHPNTYPRKLSQKSLKLSINILKHQTNNTSTAGAAA
jgi:hypothetical protein